MWLLLQTYAYRKADFRGGFFEPDVTRAKNP